MTRSKGEIKYSAQKLFKRNVPFGYRRLATATVSYWFSCFKIYQFRNLKYILIYLIVHLNDYLILVDIKKILLDSRMYCLKLHHPKMLVNYTWDPGIPDPTLNFSDTAAKIW